MAFILFYILAYLYAHSKAMDQCSYTGQVFDDCASPCGPLTCDNYTDVEVCITSCEARCDCPSEQVLDLGRRMCVTTEDCTVTTEAPDTCTLPAETGDCDGFFPRYSFNSDSGQCEQFIFGGCGGNDNNFETIEQCQQTCGCPYTGQVFDNCASPCGPLTCDNYTDVGVCITSCEARCDCPSEQVLDLGRRTCVTTEECTVATETPDRCTLPAESGLCKAAFRRFYFNSDSGQCEQFIFGGCGGNDNNFETMEQCQQTCPTACSVHGQHYFDIENGECVPCIGTCTEPQVVCIAVCASGCECPVGTLFDEKTRACVLPIQCPQKYCFEGGNFYLPGSSWNCSDGCNTCGCAGGVVTSTLIACEGKNDDLENPSSASDVAKQSTLLLATVIMVFICFFS